MLCNVPTRQLCRLQFQDTRTIGLIQRRSRTICYWLWCHGDYLLEELLREVNLSPKVTINMYTDSAAGKSMATGYGASRRTRHIELRYFYMQSLVTSGLLRTTKISGSGNVADLGTKCLGRVALSRLRDLVGVLPGVQVFDLVQAVAPRQLSTPPEISSPRPLRQSLSSAGRHYGPRRHQPSHNAR